ncbi:MULTISPECIES: enoyl-CoA hydratase/isomerase family protein [unclassified Novosphingobium]|uniref:enoyl-CoA hydratase/isomerase family protein n=1 Tax=unclassified Novosphingobium TaxID=2644732 RepID=UPI000D30534E|nr:MULTISPECIES: enoyl-CoA hydratase/isomerase family protein [unclassified Novosphingobium]PTR05810.1 enoyl-CoA hydratase [Novosphingobium sp. GV055]PUA94368.1 enoyl-CoA hydratase [Novosphingobium sp. GV061]PUB12674.1 enoyl-CoA hydratase [Novosphingobium sp. GV079]PUB38039.1 enoyl-CoA hydratase [Novosphingobium sp. GV027]
MSEVLISRDGAAGRLSLNRPKALHALTQNMCEAMSTALHEWQDDRSVQVVLIDHATDPGGDPKLSRGFCAGGDIALIRRSALEDGGAAARAFFASEYRLNHQLFTYPKPIIAFMDGITMGGGVGISQPAPFRVATLNTRYAMPETGIGLFPDVGGGWYLSRLRGHLGEFLAVTGARIDGADCLWAGLATHYLDASMLTQAKMRLAAGEAPAAVLTSLTQLPPSSRLAAHADDILRHFGKGSLEAILASLAGDSGEWAQAELAALLAKCPTSAKVSLRELAESRRLADFGEEMRMEYRLASRMILRPDFAEGVRAVIVEKDNAPRWNPATAEDVTEADLDAIFAPLEEEWNA